LDVHVSEGRGGQIAVIHDSPVTSTKEKISYRSLRDEVAAFAGVLARHGVTKGDRVLIYMPMIPQSIVAMLASGSRIILSIT
jgi:propionyl-CoA synthetase